MTIKLILFSERPGNEYNFDSELLPKKNVLKCLKYCACTN